MSIKIDVDTSQLENFFNCVDNSTKDLKKELLSFQKGIGIEFLDVLQNEIIRKRVTDLRNLLSSFQLGEKNNYWKLTQDKLTLEVGTNVEYANWVNDGHWQNKRFIPGDVVIGEDGKVKEFRYNKGAKTGMMITAKFVKGYHYWDSAIQIIEKMMPNLMEKKIQQWINKNYPS